MVPTLYLSLSLVRNVETMQMTDAGSTTMVRFPECAFWVTVPAGFLSDSGKRWQGTRAPNRCTI